MASSVSPNSSVSQGTSESEMSRQVLKEPVEYLTELLAKGLSLEKACDLIEAYYAAIHRPLAKAVPRRRRRSARGSRVSSHSSGSGSTGSAVSADFVSEWEGEWRQGLVKKPGFCYLNAVKHVSGIEQMGSYPTIGYVLSSPMAYWDIGALKALKIRRSAPGVFHLSVHGSGAFHALAGVAAACQVWADGSLGKALVSHARPCDVDHIIKLTDVLGGDVTEENKIDLHDVLSGNDNVTPLASLCGGTRCSPVDIDGGKVEARPSCFMSTTDQQYEVNVPAKTALLLKDIKVHEGDVDFGVPGRVSVLVVDQPQRVTLIKSTTVTREQVAQELGSIYSWTSDLDRKFGAKSSIYVTAIPLAGRLWQAWSGGIYNAGPAYRGNLLVRSVYDEKLWVRASSVNKPESPSVEVSEPYDDRKSLSTYRWHSEMGLCRARLSGKCRVSVFTDSCGGRTEVVMGDSVCIRGSGSLAASSTKFGNLVEFVGSRDKKFSVTVTTVADEEVFDCQHDLDVDFSGFGEDI